ncbi:MAG: LacI family transcriptional regulator [Actinomycetota bacterium]|nr:LacI family transcriptional regulator [Actinomycetota bacterium]
MPRARDRRPTMRDVATAAGVGVMTVSRVINGDVRVRPHTVRRVNLAIEELGYQRNDMASRLRRGDQSTALIGLLVDDIANPFYACLAGAVEEQVRDRGYTLLFGSAREDPARERELLSAFTARRVDGLLVVPCGDETELCRTAAAAGASMVFVDRPAHGLTVDTVLVDGRAAARQAVRHLITHGHRRIGYLGDTATIWTARERLLGYREAMAEAGIEVDEVLIAQGLRQMYTAEGAAGAMLGLAAPATALFAANDVITLGVFRAIRRAPGPVALVGFDDFALADQLDPPVTVVAQDPVLMGEVAARLLFDRMGGADSAAREVVLPTRLIVRGSGEIPPHSSMTVRVEREP